MIDNIERLECVYYSGPVPWDDAVLTTLCFVFDKIHFPNVYLPKGDYNKELLREEIARLDALRPRSHETEELINALRFLEYRLPLDGILEYPSSRDSIFNHPRNENRGRLIRTIYDVNYPPRENFEPAFQGVSVKGLPGSDEAVVFMGDISYQADAINYASDNRLPLLDDGFGLALPFRAQYKDNAKSLATVLAMESVGFGLPHLPPLTPQELVDFRMENVKELRNFRAAMMRYAKDLNAQIPSDASVEEVNRKAKFVVETEIIPTLHDLNRDLLNPNRPWHKRMADGVKIVASVGLGIATGGWFGTTVAEGIRNAIASELEAKGDRREAAERNGLYYLLRARAIGR